MARNRTRHGNGQSCRKLRDNAVRLQLHALACNLANFMRTLALPKEVEHWSLTTLLEKLVKIGAKMNKGRVSALTSGRRKVKSGVG